MTQNRTCEQEKIDAGLLEAWGNVLEQDVPDDSREVFNLAFELGYRAALADTPAPKECERREKLLTALRWFLGECEHVCGDALCDGTKITEIRTLVDAPVSEEYELVEARARRAERDAVLRELLSRIEKTPSERIEVSTALHNAAAAIRGGRHWHAIPTHRGESSR